MWPQYHSRLTQCCMTARSAHHARATLPTQELPLQPTLRATLRADMSRRSRAARCLARRSAAVAHHGVHASIRRAEARCAPSPRLASPTPTPRYAPPPPPRALRAPPRVPAPTARKMHAYLARPRAHRQERGGDAAASRAAAAAARRRFQAVGRRRPPPAAAAEVRHATARKRPAAQPRRAACRRGRACYSRVRRNNARAVLPVRAENVRASCGGAPARFHTVCAPHQESATPGGEGLCIVFFE